ncbi:MAG: hypothetical protein WDN67_03570 [Candidatus Moraniibacteriota bacterium]
MMKRHLYKNKYPRSRNDSEKILVFAVKVVGTAVFLLILSIGIDLFRLAKHFL